MHINQSFIVSIDIGEDDTAVLLVGQRVQRKFGIDAKIINAFAGEEAIELYKKLIGSEKKDTPQ